MINLLIAFIKHPTPGGVKTRLASEIGASKATIIYEHLVIDLLSHTTSNNYDRAIFVDPKHQISRYQSSFGDLNYHYQNGDNLGERMNNAFNYNFALGYENIILIGSDIPLLDSKYIEKCFDQLSSSDAIIGPTIDGGYYLIGFSKKTYTPKVFLDMLWSESSVYDNTINKLKHLNVSIAQKWFDIDVNSDLLRYQNIGMKKRISELSELELL